MAGEFSSKTKMMANFLLAGLVKTLLFMGLGLVGFVVVAVLSLLNSGKWQLGGTFSEWYVSRGATLLGNGKFSAEDGECWSCSIFSNIFDMMNMVGLKMYEFIHETVWILVVSAFAVWLLVKVWTDVIQKSGEGAQELVVECFKKALWISVISAAIGFMSVDKLRGTARVIIENTAVPLLEMGIGVGEKVLGSPVCAKLDYTSSDSTVDGVIPPELKRDFLCLVNTVNVVFSSGANGGANMVALAAKQFPNPAAILDIIGGIMIAIIFFLLAIMVPFKLVDIIFTLGILIAFTPLFIAGYAYDKTKAWSKKALDSLVGIMFNIIMYCIFIGIFYASFLYIGDMHYPGPVDNFTFLFPDFVMNSFGVSGGMSKELSSAFTTCYNNIMPVNAPGLNTSKMLCDCIAKSGMQCSLPSAGNPVQTILPIFTLGLLSLGVFSKLEQYSGIYSGWTFKIGNDIFNFMKSGFDVVINGVTKGGAGFATYKNSELLRRDNTKLKKTLSNLLDKAK